MPTSIKLGNCYYLNYSLNELNDFGLIHNPHMWLAEGGWLFCIKCNKYQHHIAMSHPRKSDCFEVCLICDTHSRDVNNPIEDIAYQAYLNNPNLDPRD